MNYTYLIPIIVVILLGISLPESLANQSLCEVFTVSAIKNYSCNPIEDTVTFLPETAMTAESDNIKNQILLNSTLDNQNIGPFDFIVFANRTGYFVINGNSGESSSNSNFVTLMNRIIASDSSIFVKSGTYPVDSIINLEPDMRIGFDAGTVIQTSYARISLSSDTIIQVPKTSLDFNSDPIILPQDDFDSESDLQQLIRNEEEISDEDFDLAQGYRKTADSSFDAEDYDEAIRTYNKVLEIIPTDSDALNGKAQSLENLGNYEEAITYYDKVLEIDSTDFDALNGKAKSLENLGNYEESITYYDKVLEIDSTDFDALNGKANALENLGNLDEAISNLEKIVEQNPLVEEEPSTTVESDVTIPASEEINDFEQDIFIIVIVFLVILNSVILINWIVKKKRNVEKKLFSKV